MRDEALNADIKAAETNFEILRKITDSSYRAQLVYKVDETGKEMPNRTQISEVEKIVTEF